MKELEKKIYEYLEERDWHHPLPADLAKSVMIEGAELLELFQWENLSLEDVKNNKEKIEEIKRELADVMIYALEMSVLLDLDTKDIILQKLDHISKKYPAQLMKDRKKDQETVNEYLKIKKEYRRNGL